MLRSSRHHHGIMLFLVSVVMSVGLIFGSATIAFSKSLGERQRENIAECSGIVVGYMNFIRQTDEKLHKGLAEIVSLSYMGTIVVSNITSSEANVLSKIYRDNIDEVVSEIDKNGPNHRLYRKIIECQGRLSSEILKNRDEFMSKKIEPFAKALFDQLMTK